jgi:hypothetical protein
LNLNQYTYDVVWLADDNEYVGLCAEFPSLSLLDSDKSKAFSGIIDLVTEVVADMIFNNEKVPMPLKGGI